MASAARPLLAQASIPLQPLAAQITRLITALEALGEPLPASDVATLRGAINSADESAATQTIISLLDRRVLMEVTINPEVRVSVRRGAVPAALIQAGWRAFLIKVNNQAGATMPLAIRSPQGGAMGRRSSFAITGVHDFTNGAVDAVESRARWIALATYDLPPMTPALSGLAVEYRILQVYSRDSGQREASLQADCGFGEQDLGFRSTLPVLFNCQPARTVALRIRDERGRSCVASLLVTDRQGRIYPAQGKRSMPDLAFEQQIYRGDGETLIMPDGAYSVECGRGPEYVAQRLPLNVAGSAASLSVSFERWVEPARFGYYSGDTHLHAAGCSHYESPTEGVTPEVMLRQTAGEALDLGSVLNWGPGFEYQKQFFSGHAQDDKVIAAVKGGARAALPLMRYDVEVSGFPSSHCGHLVLLRLKQDLYPGTHSIDDWPSWNLPILRWAKEQGAVTGYAHVGHGLVVDTTELPNYLMPPFNSSGANEVLVDVTHPGTVDFISGCDLWPFAELNVWYHLLNCGFRIAFAGETDFPCLTDECVGGGRSYVRLEGGPPHSDDGYSAWLGGLVARDAYFGDGRSHLFDLRVAADGAASRHQGSRGGDVTLQSAGAISVTATACARLSAEPDAPLRAIATSSPYAKPYWHIERARLGSSRKVAVELIVNGRPADRTEIVADGSPQPIRFTHTLDHSSWVALRILPSSHTNPMFIEIAGKPVRSSRRSAGWCLKAVDVLWEQKRTRIRPAELNAAAEAYDHARATYDKVLSESVDD